MPTPMTSDSEEIQFVGQDGKVDSIHYKGVWYYSDEFNKSRDIVKNVLEPQSDTWSRPNHGGKLMPQPETNYNLGDEINQPQSEAPSVDELENILWGLTNPGTWEDPYNVRVPKALAKINRLIVEARIDELKTFFEGNRHGVSYDQYIVDGKDIEDRIKQLSEDKDE